MAKRALLITFILLLGYSGFVYLFQEKILRTGQNQYDRNIVTAEEFLYERGQKAEVVILGSSMSSRLVMDSLPGNYFCLGLSGMGVADGIALVHKSLRKPKVVLIEMNVILRDVNSNFETDLFHPFFFTLRKHIPILRKKYQPVAVLKALIREGAGIKQNLALFKLPKSLFEQEVATLMRDENVVPEPLKFKRKFDDLYKHVQTFQKSGIEVIFFEMPFYAEAENLALPIKIRREFLKYFPATKYKYIAVPADKYETSDGVHLAGLEQLRYTRYLKRNLMAMIKRKS